MEAKDQSIVLLPEYRLELTFELQPAPESPWQLTGQSPASDGPDSHEHRVFAAGPYRLHLTKAQDPDATVFDFDICRADGEAFTLVNYTVECHVPVVDMYNVSPRFTGYAHVSHHNPPLLISTCTSKDFPYVIYGSRNGENRFAIGLENLIIETEIERHNHGGHMYYDTNLIRFRRPVQRVSMTCREHHDAIHVSTLRESWFHATRRYWQWIDQRRGFRPSPFPPSAYGPVWCSWLYGTDIDEQKILDSAVAAKELGIKTLIIDAGWFCPDTDIPFPDSPLTRDTIGFGRLDSERSKFPDMAGLVRRIHDLGLYVWAWCTPRWVFRALESGPQAVDQELLDSRIVTERGETVPLLCTRNPAARAHAARMTRYLLERYGFDGLKFDCWELTDGMDVCQAAHEHSCDTMGEGTVQWAREVYEAMTSCRPDAVVWFNNTTLKQYSNYSASPNETYCQPDENWRQSVLLKTFATGIASQLCEGSWHADEPDNSLARQLAILMMGHTPEVQVDLTRLRDSHQRIVKAWFAFYEAHKQELQHGAYEPFGFEHTLGGPFSTMNPNVKIEGDGRAYLWVGPVWVEAVALERPAPNIYLFNQRSAAGLRLTLQGLPPGEAMLTVHDHFLNPVSRRQATCDGALSIDDPAPEGGMIHITIELRTPVA